MSKFLYLTDVYVAIGKDNMGYATIPLNFLQKQMSKMTVPRKICFKKRANKKSSQSTSGSVHPVHVQPVQKNCLQ